MAVSSTTIASFDVKITSEGLLVLETKLARSSDFMEVMDKWNPAYENTPVIASMLDYYSGVFDLMVKDSQKMIF
tara:strand:- start:708 stop:929 length:222 start_codon:yes stop_codon:yes gene_type:complete